MAARRTAAITCLALFAAATCVLLFDDIDGPNQPNTAKLSALKSATVASRGTRTAPSVRSLLLYRLPCSCVPSERLEWPIVPEVPKATLVLNFWAFEGPPRKSEGNGTQAIYKKLESSARCFDGAQCGAAQYYCCIPTIDSNHVAGWAGLVMLLLLLLIPVPMLFCPPKCHPCFAWGTRCGCRLARTNRSTVGSLQGASHTKLLDETRDPPDAGEMADASLAHAPEQTVRGESSGAPGLAREVPPPSSSAEPTPPPAAPMPPSGLPVPPAAAAAPLVQPAPTPPPAAPTPPPAAPTPPSGLPVPPAAAAAPLVQPASYQLAAAPPPPPKPKQMAPSQSPLLGAAIASDEEDEEEGFGDKPSPPAGDDAFTQRSLPTGVTTKEEREQEFFKAQKEAKDAEKAKHKAQLLAMSPEERARVEQADADRQEHSDAKSKMLKKQMRTFGTNKSVLGGAARGGRGRAKGRR